MTRYRLDNVELHDIWQRGPLVEIYMITFKNNNNYVIKTEAYVATDKIISLVLDSLPPEQDIIKNINVGLRLINDKAFMDGKALRSLMDDLCRSLHKIYGGLAKPIIGALRMAEGKIPGNLMIPKKQDDYTYIIKLTSEYSLTITAVFMNTVNTSLGFSISIWRSLQLPFKTKIERGVLLVGYTVIGNKTYADRLDIQPFFANATVRVPEKIKQISLDKVIKAADQALKNYLHNSGITGYVIESIKPRWITIDQRVEGDA